MSKIELDNREAVQNEVRDWEQREVKSFLAKQKERKDQFYTSGGFPVKRTYTVLDIEDTPVEDVGLPGRFPIRAGRTRPCTAAAPGPCGRSRGSAPGRTRTSASST